MPRPYLIPLLFVALLGCFGCVRYRDPGVQEVNKNPAAYHYQMGLSFLEERNYTGALIELTEAEKYDADNPDLLYNLALAYVGKKRPDLAEEKFLAAIRLKPKNSKARNDLGVAYMQMKRWDKAIEQFQLVKDDLFFNAAENAMINLGLCYLNKGDYSRALEELKGVPDTSPRIMVIRSVAMGRALFALDRTDQAIAEYKKAIGAYRDYGEAHYYLGLAQLKQNSRDDARNSLREVLRIIPETELGRLAAGHLEQLN